MGSVLAVECRCRRWSLARPGGHREPGYLAETIVAQRVTAVDFVPSMLELFLEEPLAARCTSLTRVTVGGEALSSELANRFASTFEVPLHNLYGPTEASVDVLGWTADGGPVALGVPGWNVRAYVLDPYLNPVPPARRASCTWPVCNWPTAICTDTT